MKLPCLSIQQPLVEHIFSGHKPVENRDWTWMQARDWEREGPVLLGIHASSNRGRWNALTEAQRKKYGIEEPPIGCLVGVADLMQICRPCDLPRGLRNHDCVNTDDDNWCWVLSNPRRLSQPIQATGQARLFYVDIPERFVRVTTEHRSSRRTVMRQSSKKTASVMRPKKADAHPQTRMNQEPSGDDIWIYWEPSFADAAIDRAEEFSTADLGTFAVGKDDLVWLVTYKEGEPFLTGR